MTDWQSEQRARGERIAAGSKVAAGKMVASNDTTALLEAVIRPGDRICLEGDNQKQADFLAACLAKADPKVLHDLHVVQSGIVLPEHIDLFEKGIAKKLDFSFSGPQSHAIPRVLKSGKVELGAIHRAVRPLLRRPNSSRCLDRRSQRGPCGQSVHGSEHGGFARGHRSDRIQVRHCRCAGQ
jgi:malonate decarboxylase alpha subunit